LNSSVFHVGQEAGHFVAGFRDREIGLGVEHAALELHVQAHQLGLGGRELRLGVDGRLRYGGIAEGEDHAVGRDDGAGTQHDAFDAALGARGEPADLLRYEGTQPAHLAGDRAALHRIDPHDIAVHRGGRRLEPRNRDGDADQRDDANGSVDQPLFAFLPGNIRARDIHVTLSNAMGMPALLGIVQDTLKQRVKVFSANRD